MFFPTAYPFGYLAQLLVLCFAFAGMGVLLRYGWRHRNRYATWLGWGFGGFLAVWFLAAAFQPSIDEWNPWYLRPDSLAGRWTKEDRVIELRRDSTFTLVQSGARTSGRWNLEDWNLTRIDSAAGHEHYCRVVQSGGRLRILDEFKGDPDMWNGDLGYEREEAPMP